MRRILLAAAVAMIGSGLVSCGNSRPGGTNSASSPASSAAADCSNSAIQKDLYAKGALTVATDKPAYPPWFIANNPANGRGYESAVAYAVAAQLRFKHSQVKWVHEPFSASYAPGLKTFDFDINEISYAPQRAQAVTFSESYYDVHQALVALKGTPVVTGHSPAQLKKYVFGDEIGTTSLTFINSRIQPTSPPRIYITLNDVNRALHTDQIGALVTDAPTAQYISSSEIEDSVTVGQFPSTGEHYGLVFAKADPLVTCVNKALTTLKNNGTLTALQKRYLQIYLRVPTIQP
jgi:polar amino acid transport system substrate-binding protein